MPKNVIAFPTANVRKQRRSGNQPLCQKCGMGWNRLFDVFVNRIGWVKRCGDCAQSPRVGPSGPYRGPYPIIGPDLPPAA